MNVGIYILLLYLTISNCYIFEFAGEDTRWPANGTPRCTVCQDDQLACLDPNNVCVCIPKEKQCDYYSDCKDGEDEAFCHGCLDSEFECVNPPHCISRQHLCDGKQDCEDNSDEMYCRGETGSCIDTEFNCTVGPCILAIWRCDGDPDCPDGSDEEGCLMRTCHDMQFQCATHACVSVELVCDGNIDCSDGSDELNCSPEVITDPSKCPRNHFACDSSKCILGAQRCDGINDCDDGSDESGCSIFNTYSIKPSTRDYCSNNDSFRCDNGRCIEMDWVCNMEEDCDGGEDEANCNTTYTCPPLQELMPTYTCSPGQCVQLSRVCDGTVDCDNGADETHCSKPCSVIEFPCGDLRSNQTCLSRTQVCDGLRHCPNGEDEAEELCRNKVVCKEMKNCTQLCRISSKGGEECFCRLGYQLNKDMKTCEDVDECEHGTVCSQLCENTEGGFKCSCTNDYILRPDGRTCKAKGPPPTLLFANRIDIRQITFDSKEYTSVVGGLNNAIALDFSYKRGLLYWSDVTVDAIKSSYMNGSHITDVIRWGLDLPSGIALDWIHEHLYWTDSGTRRIEVCQLDGRHRKTLLWENLQKPRAITLHPGEGVILWTDWGDTALIEKAGMDGSNRQAIVNTSLYWPNGLAIDYTTGKVYWADAKHHIIECADLDGGNRRKVVEPHHKLVHPFAITMFEESIFWTDWYTKSILSANKMTGRDTKVVHMYPIFPMGVHCLHPSRQPEFPNRCGDNNGGCSHLCLPNETKFSCNCPTGYSLEDDMKTCIVVPDQLLVFVRKGSVHIMPVDTAASVDAVIPLDGLVSATALDWDSKTDMIYWSDIGTHTISRSFINGSKHELILWGGLDNVTSLSIDWVTQKLFWVDAMSKRIEVSNLDGTMRLLLVYERLERPSSIVADPIGGYLYWCDTGEHPRIERIGMDGSSRQKIITENLIFPSGMTIDHDHQHGRLYWVDSGKHTIEYSSLTGKNRKTLLGDLPYPYGITVFENQVFWTDFNTSSIYSVDKVNGTDITTVRSEIAEARDVKVFHRKRHNVSNLCEVNNGGCSHFCLLAPVTDLPQQAFTCACPTGIKLRNHLKACDQLPNKYLLFAHRSDIRMLSLDVPYRVDIVLPLPVFKNVVTVDMDTKTGEIYFSDTAEDVLRKTTSAHDYIVNVHHRNLDAVDGIAVDSIGRKLYWTDTGRKSLEVSELDGSHRKLLIHKGLDRPRAIVLNYPDGTMFWSDWGNHPSITRATMDGKNRSVLISKELGWPNGLSIERRSNGKHRLWWCDAQNKVIESIHLDGTNRKIVLSDLLHPYGLSVGHNRVYWTDWVDRTLMTAAYTTRRRPGRTDKMVRDLNSPMDVKFFEKPEKEMKNVCGDNNGGCSHLCLRSTTGYSCACPTGVVMGEDGRTCVEPPARFLLYVSQDGVGRISLDSPEIWDVHLPVPNVHNAVAVDFDYKNKFYYYTDIYLNSIRKVSMRNASNIEIVLQQNLSTPNSLAVDWMAKNLYWTDTGRKVLEVSRLDGSSRKIIVSKRIEEPRSVAVHPKRGFLYWTDWKEDARIERSYLDGSKRKTIVSSDLGWPNGLSVDIDMRLLYWADSLNERVERSDLGGGHRNELVKGVEHPYSLTQLGRYLYWVDWETKGIERVDKTSGSGRVVLRAGLSEMMDIKAVAPSKQQGGNICSSNNGYCSHLCLFKGGKDYVCACPDHSDGRPCSTKPIRKGDNRLLADEEGVSLRAWVGITVASLVIFVVLIVGIICVFRRMACTGVVVEEQQLSFTNPTYSSSSSDVTLEKRPFLFRRMKSDRPERLVYEVPEEKSEVSSLISPPQPPTPDYA